MTSFDMHIDSRYRNILEYPNSSNFVLLCNPSATTSASFNQQYLDNSIFYRWAWNGFYSVLFPGYSQTVAKAQAILSNGQVVSTVITQPGSGYLSSSTTTVTFDAPESAQQAQATCSITNGQVSQIQLTSPGSNYQSSSTTTITFTPPRNGGRRAQATVIIQNGKVEQIVLQDPGSGYTTAPYIIISNPLPSQTAQGQAQIINGKVQSITITNPGSNYYTTVPSIFISTTNFPQTYQKNNAMIGRIMNTPATNQVILPMYFLSNEVNLYSGLLFTLYVPSVPITSTTTLDEIYAPENVRGTATIEFYNPLTNLCILAQSLDVVGFGPGAFFAIVNPSYLYANQLNLLGINEFVSVLSQNYIAQAFLKQNLSTNYFVQNVSKGWSLPIEKFTNALRSVQFSSEFVIPSFQQNDLIQVRRLSPQNFLLQTRSRQVTDTDPFTACQEHAIVFWQISPNGFPLHSGLYEAGQRVYVIPQNSFLSYSLPLSNIAKYTVVSFTINSLTERIQEWNMTVENPGRGYQNGMNCFLIPESLYLSNSYPLLTSVYVSITIDRISLAVPLEPDSTAIQHIQDEYRRSISQGISFLLYAPSFYLLTSSVSDVPGLSQVQRTVYIPPTSSSYHFVSIQQNWLFYTIFQVDYSFSSILGISTLNLELSTLNVSGPEPFKIRYSTIIEFLPILSRTVGITMPMISYNQPVCYRARLISLSLPNEPVVGFSLLPSFFPYFLIELQNTSGLASNQQLIYSNNPFMSKVTFVATIANPRNQELSNYVVVYSFQTTVMKFIPNDHLRVRILLPNGNPLLYVYDEKSIELSLQPETKDSFYLQSLYAQYTFKNITMRLQFIQS